MSRLPTLKPEGKAILDEHLKKYVESKTIPAVFYGATNAAEVIYYNQMGDLHYGDPSKGQVNEDTTMEMYSQTKLITCLCALILFQEGKAKLDDPEQIEKVLPELKDLPVFHGYDDNGDAILKPATQKITLRMLMSHSAGFVYSHTPSVLSKHFEKHPMTPLFDASATPQNVLCHPLAYEPGTSWCYSVSIDWVGVFIERVSGKRLDKYMEEKIFKPLNLKDFTFFPTDEIKKRKMSLCFRNEKGEPYCSPNGFGMNRPTEVSKISTKLLTGGAGLFGTQKEYLAILRAILASDPKKPKQTSNPLLHPESYDELFKGCIDQINGKKGLVNQLTPPGYFDPPVNESNVDHSCGFLINLEDFNGRRKAGSGAWSGAAKTQFWIDPATGIAGICGTQLLSPAPDPWFKAFTDYEKTLYSNLA